MWKIIARHNCRVGCTIIESTNEDSLRFTATIRGFRKWKIYKGKDYCGLIKEVVEKVEEIREKIDSNDEAIFCQKGYFLEMK
mgnify:FL=1